MNYQDLAPYLTPVALGGVAIGTTRFLRGLARFMYRRAKASKSKRDDAIAARWLAHAEVMHDVTDFAVRWFVPAAFASHRETDTTPGLERAEADERGAS